MSEEAKLKPGQKFPTPTPGNGDRVFYETLLSQIPASEMAQDWCLAYGVLDESEAKKLFKASLKRKERGRGSSRSPPPPSSSGGGGERKKKKRGKKVLDDVAYDVGMDAGGDEGIGTAAL
ncbi:hypothetical protein ACHAWF_003624 [Thalassiosira exigua]